MATASELYDGGWRVIVWDVPITEWPESDAWTIAVRSTFDSLLAAGCVVAWIGREGYFCDPPDLFLPSCMSEGVVAAATVGGFFSCPVVPDKPLKYLTDEELLEIRSQSDGLAGLDG